MKNSSLILFGGVILLIAVGLAFIAKSDAPTPRVSTNGASVLAATEDFFDFGTIKMRDGKVSRVFTVRNDSAEQMTIQSVYTSCMCTEALVTDALGKEHGPFGMPGHTSPRTKIEVGAGESVSVKAIFDPAAHGPSGVGLAERSIYLETSSAEKPRVELKFKAVVTR